MILLTLGAMLLHAIEMPMGSAPTPVAFPHFPDTLHAYVWRNWELVPPERLAEVVGATPEQIVELGESMGLSGPPAITEEQRRRSYITVIRRNWHLLPYEQLLQLLDWTPEELVYTLREDDFLFIKLGSLKPECEPLKYAEPTAEAKARAAEIARCVGDAFPAGVGQAEDPLFAFVERLSRMPEGPRGEVGQSLFSPRYCPSYFALYGDPLLEDNPDSGSFPDGYLARLADSGVDGVWMQAVLYKLTPFPWDESLSARYRERLANLRALVARANRQGIGVYLYLNEPRAMPLSFYEKHPDMKGVVEGDYAAMCTSSPEVQAYIRDAVALICREVPDLAGFFTISASENLTNCWSHNQGKNCPRCSEREPRAVISELHGLIREGIARAGGKTRLIAWDWGWNDAWAEGIIAGLPKDVALMSVSEWSIPINRGGVDTVVGEYSISEVGPGPRATRHWDLARKAGLKTMAKVQTNNTWELSPVPYVPAVANVAKHAANLREAKVDGLMLSWTLGGCPSPNLEVVAEIGREPDLGIDDAMLRVAQNRVGPVLAPTLVEAWKAFSTAFAQYPYHISVVYTAPAQMGPANPLWESPTGYAATMVGLPYDNVDAWRSVYPADVFAGQFRKVADGFDKAIAGLEDAAKASEAAPEDLAALSDEIRVARACAIHFHSVANQTEFVTTRNALSATTDNDEAKQALDKLEALLKDESALAKSLHSIQCGDSRIGFEASNHYFYVPLDLVEKVVNCTDLLTRWLPAERAKRGL